MPKKSHSQQGNETSQAPFKFTAEMIGSEILERFSTDIYNPRASAHFR